MKILRTPLNVNYIDTDAKVRDRCHIAEKYRSSVHRE